MEMTKERPIEKGEREVLTTPQRIGEGVTIVVLLLMAGFFRLHQSMDTGFFTADFGPTAMLCLYGPIAVALIPPAIRALGGRRNPARLFEAAANLSLALGSLWLLRVFPFDFTHLADVFPAPMRFGLAWMTNDIGRYFMIFQVTVMFIAAIANTVRFFFNASKG